MPWYHSALSYSTAQRLPGSGASGVPSAAGSRGRRVRRPGARVARRRAARCVRLRRCRLLRRQTAVAPPGAVLTCKFCTIWKRRPRPRALLGPHPIWPRLGPRRAPAAATLAPAHAAQSSTRRLPDSEELPATWHNAAACSRFVLKPPAASRNRMLPYCAATTTRMHEILRRSGAGNARAHVQHPKLLRHCSQRKVGVRVSSNYTAASRSTLAGRA